MEFIQIYLKKWNSFLLSLTIPFLIFKLLETFKISVILLILDNIVAVKNI